MQDLKLNMYFETFLSHFHLISEKNISNTFDHISKTITMNIMHLWKVE